MKEILVVSYCDGDHEDERVRSTVERVMSVDGSKPVALDLCDECDGLVSRLLHLMDRGAVVKAPTAKRKSSPAAEKAAPPTPRPNTKFHEPTGKLPPLGGPHICPECGFESKSRNALGQHLTVTHSKRFRDYADAA